MSYVNLFPWFYVCGFYIYCCFTFSTSPTYSWRLSDNIKLKIIFSHPIKLYYYVHSPLSLTSPHSIHISFFNRIKMVKQSRWFDRGEVRQKHPKWSLSDDEFSSEHNLLEDTSEEQPRTTKYLSNKKRKSQPTDIVSGSHMIQLAS